MCVGACVSLNPLPSTRTPPHHFPITQQHHVHHLGRAFFVPCPLLPALSLLRPPSCSPCSAPRLSTVFKTGRARRGSKRGLGCDRSSRIQSHGLVAEPKASYRSCGDSASISHKDPGRKECRNRRHIEIHRQGTPHQMPSLPFPFPGSNSTLCIPRFPSLP
jgi:hypothetical protein